MSALKSLLLALAFLLLLPSPVRAVETQPSDTSTPGNPFTGPQANFAMVILNTLHGAAGELKAQGFGSLATIGLYSLLYSALGSNLNLTILGNGQGVAAFVNNVRTMSPAQLNQLFTHDIFAKPSGSSIPETNNSSGE